MTEEDSEGDLTNHINPTRGHETEVSNLKRRRSEPSEDQSAEQTKRPRKAYHSFTAEEIDAADDATSQTQFETMMETSEEYRELIRACETVLNEPNGREMLSRLLAELRSEVAGPDSDDMASQR